MSAPTLTSLATRAKVTWCPGCPDAAILVAFRQAVVAMAEKEELAVENLVAFAGIGCHGKISDYLNVNTFESLHGRLLPTMTGTKLANGALTVVGFSGDGDSLAEGAEHFVHAAKRNSHVALFLHDNQVFALTTGQVTPTSPKGQKGKSTPAGHLEEPMNPLVLALASGATFVARSYAGDIARTKEVMRAAMLHKGFAFVDIIQPCITFNDTRSFFQERIAWVDENAPKDDWDAAVKTARDAEKVWCGTLYRVERPTFEEQVNAA